MYLERVEHHHPASPWGVAAEAMLGAGIPVPQILHLFNYKPQRTQYLAMFTQEVMRGESPLSPGHRELIAAFTARARQCPF
jgi:alkylhydroperoxidase family enzyme